MFLTGGTGLVGSHVASVLRTEKLRVRALHRATSNTEHLEGIGCELVEGALEDDEGSLAHLLAGCEALVHAAALTHTDLPWVRIRAVNVEGTRRVFLAAASAGIRRAVHISSVAVYGGQEGPIDELSGLNSRLHPRERYARSKRESELVVREVSEGKGKGMAVAVLRPSALYGERDRVLTPKLVQSLRLLVHPLLGGGRTTMAIVYAGNLAHAVLAGLRGPVPIGVRVYNVADDYPVTQKWLCSGFASQLGIEFRPASIPASVVLALAGFGDAIGLKVPGVGGLPLRRVARLAVRSNPYRSSRIRDELGWEPVVPRDEALARTVRWIEKAGSPLT